MNVQHRSCRDLEQRPGEFAFAWHLAEYLNDVQFSRPAKHRAGYSEVSFTIPERSKDFTIDEAGELAMPEASTIQTLKSFRGKPAA
jgi:hypothetical protein